MTSCAGALLHYRMHSLTQFSQTKRFKEDRQTVGGLQGLITGHQEDRDPRGAECACELEAALPWKPDVDEGSIDPLTLDDRPSVLAIGRTGDRKSCHFKAEHNHVSDVLVIIDDEYAGP